jgi:hypothetical protein
VAHGGNCTQAEMQNVGPVYTGREHAGGVAGSKSASSHCRPAPRPSAPMARGCFAGWPDSATTTNRSPATTPPTSPRSCPGCTWSRRFRRPGCGWCGGHEVEEVLTIASQKASPAAPGHVPSSLGLRVVPTSMSTLPARPSTEYGSRIARTYLREDRRSYDTQPGVCCIERSQVIFAGGFAVAPCHFQARSPRMAQCNRPVDGCSVGDGPSRLLLPPGGAAGRPAPAASWPGAGRRGARAFPRRDRR